MIAHLSSLQPVAVCAVCVMSLVAGWSPAQAHVDRLQPERPAAAAPTPTPAAPGTQFTSILSGTQLADALRPPSLTFKTGQGAPPAQVISDNPFITLFPETARLPVPSWLKLGARVTYRIESATINRDPDEKGSTGAGYAQYDLVALDAGTAVASMKLWIDSSDGGVRPSSVSPSLGVPGAGAYWLNPQVLEDAEKVATDKMIVARMPTTIGGKTYQAVRFQYQDDGAEYVWMFDASTGLLLFYRHAIGTEDDPSRQLASSTFVRRRQIQLPWQAGGMPAWVKKGARLTYEGGYSALIPGSPATVLPYSVRVQVKSAGAAWCAYQLADALSGRGNPAVERISGSAQIFDGLWLSPKAIQALRSKRGVLDRDPVTGAQIAVSRAEDGATVLTESGDGYATVLAYGSDGALVASSQDSQVGIATTRIELKLTSRR
jgi:hypothetical protein